MQHVERLDFSKPPPGFDLSVLPRHLTMTVVTAGVWGPNVLAAAWAYRKALHDPPGMEVNNDAFYVLVGPQFLVDVDIGDRLATEAEARAAAWVWYERRAALEELRCRIGVGLLPDQWWPRCLSWSDNQVAAVEYWLDEGDDVPEVLRG